MGTGLRKAEREEAEHRLARLGRGTPVRVTERTWKVGEDIYGFRKGVFQQIPIREASRRVKTSSTVTAQYERGERDRVARYAYVLRQPPGPERAARRAAGESDYPEVEPVDLGTGTQKEAEEAFRDAFKAGTADGSYMSSVPVWGRYDVAAPDEHGLTSSDWRDFGDEAGLWPDRPEAEE